MHKLKVGVVVDLNLLETTGGAFFFYQSLLQGINTFTFDNSIEIINIVFYVKTAPDVHFLKPVVFIKGNIANSYELTKKVGKIIPSRRFKHALKRTSFVKYLISSFDRANSSNITQQLTDNQIDLVYYLKPEYVHSLDYPFITTHWDIGHKSTYAFPELTMNGSYERRENYYSNILNKALLILCESEAGKTELANYYNFNPAKVKVLPIFGNSKLIDGATKKASGRILSDYQLTINRFFLYPAQFWANKNHYNLVIAFHSFQKKKENQDYKLVLCGSDQGNMTYIKHLVEELSLKDSVIFTGFVPEEKLCVLYCSATALVMPTFLGPTNMPLIEAAYLSCPVLCSDLDGHKEIMGENAVYFTPEDSDTIEKALTRITDSNFRSQLIDTALIHIRQSKFNLEKTLRVLNKTLLELKPVRKAWR